MDFFPLIIFLGIGWVIFKNVKAAGKGIEKAAKGLEDIGTSDDWRENMSAIQARIKEHAARDEFEVSPELNDDWSFDKTPTQRGRERLARKTQTQQRRARKNKREASVKNFDLSGRKGSNRDQNRSRRDDWGQRSGAELVSAKSLLVLLALGFIVLYVLSKVSPSDIGL